MKKITLLFSFLVAALVMASTSMAADYTIYPTSITKSSGAVSSVAISALKTQDQSGTQNDWNKYLEFTPGTIFKGIFNFNLPTGVKASDIISYKLKVNYLGQAKTYQTWTFNLKNQSTGSWTMLGTNSTALGWVWSPLSFSIAGGANYVSSTGILNVQYSSNNNYDASDLDYLALVITTGTVVTSSPTPTPTPVTTGTKVSFFPIKTTEVLANPFKGFATYLDGAVDSTTIPQSLVWDDVTWRQLEPVRGQFAWTTFENGWAHQVALGRKIGFRLKMADPWISPANGIPDWLISMGVPMRAYSIDGGSGNAPDWNNETLLTEHTRLLKALGARYNNDPRIAFIDVGSYGFWGEWHVYLNPSLAATDASKQRMLNDYIANFPNKKLVIPFDDDYATNFMVNQKQGVRNDCLGDSASNNYYLDSLNMVSSTTNATVFKTGIITGEFCGSEAGAVAGVSTNYSLNLNFVKNTHWSFIGPAGGSLNAVSDPLLKQNSEAFYKAMGYHFVVNEVSHENKIGVGGSLNLTIKLTNEGVAPFYYPWPIELTIKDATGNKVASAVQSLNEWDIRKWLPGTTTLNFTWVLPNTLVPKKYQLGMAILDPGTQKPGVRLGNANRDTEGRYYFSEFEIY